MYVEIPTHVLSHEVDLFWVALFRFVDEEHVIEVGVVVLEVVELLHQVQKLIDHELIFEIRTLNSLGRTKPDLTLLHEELEVSRMLFQMLVDFDVIWVGHYLEVLEVLQEATLLVVTTEQQRQGHLI